VLRHLALVLALGAFFLLGAGLAALTSEGMRDCPRVAVLGVALCLPLIQTVRDSGPLSQLQQQSQESHEESLPQLIQPQPGGKQYQYQGEVDTRKEK
jgi:hypothetical protein